MLTASLNPKTLKQPRMVKKISEVKEVIQNRTDMEIAKVLEYFEYDVGKSIDAFVNDGGKEALAKWAETKSQLNSSQSSLVSDSGRKQNGKTKANLNDLVASVINQFTSSTPTTPLNSQEVKKPEPQILIDSLNRLNTETSIINGYKVTILGIETPNSDQAVSTGNSSSTSPSSLSVTSSASSCDRPQVLDLNNSLLKIPTNNQRQFNKNYINPNAKSFLEKSVKDLQRQTLQLNKIQNSFQDQIEKSTQLLNKTYQQLLSVLNERKKCLDMELVNSSQRAMGLIQERQSKAASLKHLTDNSQHLNDVELNELKADLKHFVSERQLDEEFTKVNMFNLDTVLMERLLGDLNTFGLVYNVKNQYSTQRSTNIEDFLTPVKDLNVVEQKIETQTQNNTNPKPQRTNNNNNNKKENKQILNGSVNGATNGINNSINKGANNKSVHHVDDGQGEFIEVKKPQRNRNKPFNGVQQQNGQLNQKPVVNGVQNSSNRNENTRR
ncbi:unnamed protein product [Brachionus calyciflorus]|uniref:Uncharacterized protein n=1 Tax=Brachionus calyciflorus TaxID=104777 RepID=A0A813Q8C4_9BILA|nr:unnamed protein product [Brachionus calyciflorus]